MLCVLLAVVITSGWLSGCSSDGDKTNEQPEQAANSQQSDGTGSGTGDTITVDLLHTYTTRFGEVNQLTYPRFSFDYPDNWKITSEEVTEIAEEVTLTNDTGITVTYWNFHGTVSYTHLDVYKRQQSYSGHLARSNGAVSGGVIRRPPPA